MAKQRGQSFVRFYELAFLYCLSLVSCVAAEEESVAFRGGSPEVSTRGDTTTQNEVTYQMNLLLLRAKYKHD